MPVHYSQRLFPLTLWTAQDLDDNGELTSDAISCLGRVPDVLMLKVTHATGAPDVKVQVRVSNDGVNFNSAGSQDDLVTSTNTTYASQNPQEYHALVCPSAPWIKIVITEVSGANLNNNVVDVTLWMREL